VGLHGLLISWHGRRGLLLPQVPVERGWDRKTFLEQTCRKAGLPQDAWQKGATIEAFTAEVFGESSVQ
jgi:AMMECR1 domain-containing protein